MRWSWSQFASGFLFALLIALVAVAFLALGNWSGGGDWSRWAADVIPGALYVIFAVGVIIGTAKLD